MGKDALDEVDADIVADNGFLEQTCEDEENGTSEHLVGHTERTAYLWDEVAGTDDGACDELREERDVEGVVEDVVQRL